MQRDAAGRQADDRVSAGELGRRAGSLGQVERPDAGVDQGWDVVGEPVHLGEANVSPARLQALLGRPGSAAHRPGREGPVVCLEDELSQHSAGEHGKRLRQGSSEQIQRPAKVDAALGGIP
jgi:hypothetical protein